MGWINNLLLAPLISGTLLFSGCAGVNTKIPKSSRIIKDYEKDLMPSLDGFVGYRNEGKFCENIGEKIIVTSYVSKRGGQIALSARRENGESNYLIVLKGIGYLNGGKDRYGIKKGEPEDKEFDDIVNFTHRWDYCYFAPKVIKNL